MLRAVKNLMARWLDFWNDQEKAETPFTILFCLQILSVVMLYTLFRKFLFGATSLAEPAYFQPILTVEFLKEFSAKPLLVVAAIAGIGLFNKRLGGGWQEFENGFRLRNIIVFLTILLAWRNAFYPYNYYLDQTHLVDRLLLLLLAALVGWRPIFVVPFLCVLLSIIGQFKLLAGYALADSVMLIQILSMFVAFQIFWLANRQFSYINFLFMTGCLVASNYFFSGVNKVNYEWIFVNNVGNLLTQSYAIGWNRYLGPEGIHEFVQWVSFANPLAKLMTLIIEIGVLFFFFRLRWVQFLLSTAIVFHIGIFFCSGICFWLWSLVHLFFLVLVWQQSRGYELDRLFNRGRGVVAIALIASASIWSSPVVLYWLDIPLQSVSRVYATCQSGETYELSPDFFGENDFNFTFQDFQFLRPSSKAKRLGNSDSQEAFRFFNQERTNNEIFEFESKGDRRPENLKGKQQFEKFVGGWVKNYNRRSSSYKWLGFLDPPDLLWQATGVRELPAGETVKKLSVRCATHYFSHESGPRVVREELVADIGFDP